MGTRSIIRLVVGGLAIAAVVGLVHQIRERAKFELLAKQKQVVIDSLNAQVTTDSLTLVEVVRWAEDSLTALRTVAVEAEEKVVSWRRESERTQEELNDVIETLPDSLQERVNSVVENLVAQHQQEVLAYEELVGNLRAQTVVLNEQLLATQNLNASLHLALTEANEQIKFYRNIAEPSLLASIKSDLLKLFIATGFGYGIAKATN